MIPTSATLNGISSTCDQHNDQQYCTNQYESDYDYSSEIDNDYHKNTTKIGKNAPWGDVCPDIDEQD